MRAIRARLDENGCLTIPETCREALNLGPGDEVLIRLEGSELRVSSPRAGPARARRLLRRYMPDDDNLTQSLIDDRRREAGLE